MAGELDDAALRGEVAAEDRGGRPIGLIGVSIGTTTSWPGRLDDRGRDLAERAAVDVGRVRVDQALLRQLARDERDAAGAVDVGRDVAAAGLQAREDRRARRDLVEVVELVNGIPSSRAIASRWRTPFVEPPVAATEAAAFSSASRVTIWRGRRSFRSDLHREPAGLVGGLVLASARAPGSRSGRRARCRGSRARVDIVFAVNWPPQAPAPGQATDSSSCSVLGAHRPGRVGADRLEHVLDRHVLAAEAPGRDRAVVEHERRGCRAARAPSPRPGSSCRSRPGRRARRRGGRARRARSSRRSPRARRATRACPSVPIETPSETEIVLNSIGVPPASRMPRFTCWASSRWLRLHGIVSIHVVATPMIGRARSSSVKPMPFSIARAAARSGPSVSAAEWRLAGSDGRSYGFGTVIPSRWAGRRVIQSLQEPA